MGEQARMKRNHNGLFYQHKMHTSERQRITANGYTRATPRPAADDIALYCCLDIAVTATLATMGEAAHMEETRCR